MTLGCCRYLLLELGLWTRTPGYTTFRNTTSGLYNIQKHNHRATQHPETQSRALQHSEKQPQGYTTFRNTTSWLYNIQKHNLRATQHSEAQTRAYKTFKSTTSGLYNIQKHNLGLHNIQKHNLGIHNIQKHNLGATQHSEATHSIYIRVGRWSLHIVQWWLF